MHPMNFRKGHAILSEDQGGEADGLNLQVAVVLEKYDWEDHNESTLSWSLPNPRQKVHKRQLVGRLQRVIESGVLEGSFFLYSFNCYVNVLVQDERENWPKCENGGVSQLQVRVEYGDGDIEEDARENHLYYRDNETTMNDERCEQSWSFIWQTSMPK